MTAPAIADPGTFLGRTGRSQYLHGLDLLRIVASTLVVYTHVANWFATRGHTWGPSALVDRDVVGTLRLNPTLGYLGVAMFFMVSGVVVTHVADRERPGQFLRRRLARIVPLLLAVTVLAWCLVNLGWYVPQSQQRSLDALDLLKAMTLAGFFTDPEVILLGIAWTLVVQIAFYAYIAATIPLLRRHPWLPPALAAALVCLTLSLVTAMGGGMAGYRVGVVAAHLPVLCLGMLISLVRSGKVPAWAGIALGAVHFLLFVWADKLTWYTGDGHAYPRTVVLVFLVVVVAAGIGGRISRCSLTRAWSSRTYAIYLLHPLCIYPLMDQLVVPLGWGPALLAALLLLAASSELFHRFLEMPANRWVRKRERRARDPRPVGNARG